MAASAAHAHGTSAAALSARSTSPPTAVAAHAAARPTATTLSASPAMWGNMKTGASLRRPQAPLRWSVRPLMRRQPLPQACLPPHCCHCTARTAAAASRQAGLAARPQVRRGGASQPHRESALLKTHGAQCDVPAYNASECAQLCSERHGRIAAAHCLRTGPVPNIAAIVWVLALRGHVLSHAT